MPHPIRTLERLAGRMAAWALMAAVLLIAASYGSPARAQADPPGRVGRLADFNGAVSWWDDETAQWADAQRNRPLTGGDRISTATSGRAELRVGSTVLRLSNDTELEVLRLDDERMVFQLHSGSVALRVRGREVADEIELVTAEARLLPQRAGHYRLDRSDDLTRAGSWRGMLRIGDSDGQLVGEGQRVELERDGSGGLRQSWINPADDGFSAWVTAEDRREERSAAAPHVSPEMTGAEDLDRYGRWDQHPEYGALWLPLEVRADWAPYRYGRWSWVAPWGWTWIDDAPWGFAPFHYGRWVSWRGRWGWVPGAYVARPVYAPALVAWIGGGHWGVSVQIGGPTVGWVPLAPREVYRPHYHVSPIYIDRVNPNPPYRWRHPPRQVPTGPISYGNQGVPNAVTVVPRDVLTRRQPVEGRVVVDGPRGGVRGPVKVLPPPPAPETARPPRRPLADRVPLPREPVGRVQPVPGGAQRLPAPVATPQPTPPAPHAGVPAVRGDRRDDRRDDGREGRRDEHRDGRPALPRHEDRQDGRREDRGPVIDLRQTRPAVPQVPRPDAAAGPARPAPVPQPAPQRPAPAPQAAPPAPAPAAAPRERVQVPERAQTPERGPRQRERERDPQR